jgi:hypothetical protein
MLTIFRMDLVFGSDVKPGIESILSRNKGSQTGLN